MASSDRDGARAVMRLSPPDNIAIALRQLKAGEAVLLDGVAFTIQRSIAVGHKLAARAIAKDEIILKYGCPIGIAIAAIAPGEPVTAQNVETDYFAATVSPASRT
jgi:altronate hydrolase